MKLLYLANIRLPTEKAHGAQIMKMCESFARQGCEVELVVPTRNNEIKDDPFKYYGVEKNFTVTYVPTPDTVGWGSVRFLLQSLLFALGAARAMKGKHFDVLYGRDDISARLISPLKLFGHMAAGIPLVASDLPSIREVVGDAEAILVKPDDPQALAEGITRSLADPSRAIAAKNKATSYTWDARAQTILAAL